MICETIKTPGLTAIVCRGGRRKIPPPCRFCGKTSSKLCDFPVSKKSTCDAPMCDDCATSIGQDSDLCPAHVKIWRGK